MAKQRPCVHCGVIFLPEFPQGAARTCSDDCAAERRKATRRVADRKYRRVHAEEMRPKNSERAKRNRPKRKVTEAAWIAKNRDHYNAAKRAWYAENHEAILVRIEANRDAINARRRENRRLKREGAEHDGA